MPLEYEDILGIKEAIYEGIPQKVVAQRFFLDPSTVSKICRGHLYSEVPWPSGALGALDPEEYRKIRFERRQSEAANPLNESPLKSHFLDEEATAIEGASHLLKEIGHLLEGDEYEFEPEDLSGVAALDPDDPDLDRQLAGATGAIGPIDPMKELEELRQERLRSLRRQRAALDELGEAAARQLDDEIDEVTESLATEGEVSDSRVKPSSVAVDGWDWDEVLALAPDVEIVKLIEDNPDEFPNLSATKAAVGAVLKAMPEHQWSSKTTVNLIAGLTKQIGEGK
tara:strand:- start:3225 stop:4073 length:849 start_codon:yes stop_codon:yes gene_type:complete